jgi:hypothetical protein
MLSKDALPPMPVFHFGISILAILFTIAMPLLIVLALIKLAFGGGRRRRRRVEDAEARGHVLERAWRSMDAMEARVDKLEALLLERRRGAGKTRQ